MIYDNKFKNFSKFFSIMIELYQYTVNTWDREKIIKNLNFIGAPKCVPDEPSVAAG